MCTCQVLLNMYVASGALRSLGLDFRCSSDFCKAGASCTLSGPQAIQFRGGPLEKSFFLVGMIAFPVLCIRGLFASGQQVTNTLKKTKLN